MAIDEALLISLQEGRSPPTLRFYGWHPATLSIGYFQQAEREVDFEALRRRGIGFVRRPTGGRAVLHDRELTYSIVAGEAYPGMPAGVEEACRMLSEGLLLGYRRLGLDARINGSGSGNGSGMGSGSTPGDGAPRSMQPESSACFETPSRYELVLEGRKAAGSSQMRAKGAILQHGSIPAEMDAERLFGVLRFGSEEERIRSKRIFGRKAVALGDVLRGRDLPVPSMEEMERAFLAGFAEALSARMIPGGLSPFEEELAVRLVKEKYGTDEWNMRR